MKPPLILADFELAAATLRVPVAAIRAFAEVESRGSGFLPDDRPVILFERHVFRRQLIAHGANLATVTDLEKRRPDLCNKTPGGYGSSSKEWQRLDDAVQIHRVAALESCSWGAFQVMGFNWKRCGYTGVQDFVNAMFKSSAAHLDSFVRYIQSDANLLKALRAQDWATCARLYNGPNFSINSYDTKLADAYAKHAGRS
jgi:hypothetical protein